MQQTEFTLHGEYVTLGQLLKLTGVIGSGGEAKLYLADSIVLVNGEREERRGRKLRSGDVVKAPGAPAISVSVSVSVSVSDGDNACPIPDPDPVP